MKNVYNKYINDKTNCDIITKISIISLIIVISGVFGFVYEFIFYYFNGGMETFYYRGSNFLPWINIYAIGSLLIYFITSKYKKNKLKVFILSTLICGILEYIAGYILFTYFGGFRCWDYNTEILNFGNIQGYICLRSVLFFGLSSLLLMYCIVPFCYYISSKMSKKSLAILAISICAIFLLDEIYNLLIARIFELPRASDIYKQIGFKYVSFK